MPSFADGKIEAYVGPKELGAADDLEEVIVDFIAGARSTLDIAVQELDSEPIAQAILDARWRGVSVNLFLEQDYLRTPLKSSKGVPVAPASEGGGDGAGCAPPRSVGRRRHRARSESDDPRRAASLRHRGQGRLQPEDLPPEVRAARLPRRQGDEAR